MGGQVFILFKSQGHHVKVSLGKDDFFLEREIFEFYSTSRKKSSLSVSINLFQSTDLIWEANRSTINKRENCAKF